MNVKTLSPYFTQHWSLKLFNLLPQVHYLWVSLLASLALYLVGLVIFVLVGAPLTYLLGLLPYMFLAGFSLIFASYGWWIKALQRMLVGVFPAFSISSRNYLKLVSDWDHLWLNKPWASLIFGVPFALLNLRDVLSLWRYGVPLELNNWLAQHAWGLWIASPQALAFGLWYGFLHVVLTSLALGSGVAGIIATIWLAQLLSRQNLKLTYYEKLNLIVAQNATLAFWVLIALASISFLSRPFDFSLLRSSSTALASPQTNLALSTLLTSLIQGSLALLALLAIFGLPLYICHTTIRDAKVKYSTNLMKITEELYLEISQLTRSASAGKAPEKTSRVERLEELHRQLLATNALLADIEKIPTWPVSMSSKVQIIGGFAVSILSPVAKTWFTQLLGL